MPGIGIGRNIPRHKSRVWGGQVDPGADLKELALFDIVQNKSAATMMRVYNTGTSSSFDVAPLPGIPKNRTWNFIQSSDGKFGTYGLRGINDTQISMTDGILTLTAGGAYTIVGFEFYPVVRAVKNTKLFMRAYTRLVSGNVPTASYTQFQNTSGLRDVVYNTISGHSCVYRYNETGKLTSYKDWKPQTDMAGVDPVTTSAGIASFPVDGYKLINPYPIVIGGSADQIRGSVRTLIQWNRVLTDEEVSILSKCML